MGPSGLLQCGRAVKVPQKTNGVPQIYPTGLNLTSGAPRAAAPMILSGVPAEERDRLLALSEEELANEGWTLESVTRFRTSVRISVTTNESDRARAPCGDLT